MLTVILQSTLNSNNLFKSFWSPCSDDDYRINTPSAYILILMVKIDLKKSSKDMLKRQGLWILPRLTTILD